MKTILAEQENADIETSSEGYAQRFSGNVGRWMLKKQADIVVDLLKKCNAEALLDVGGGHAQLTQPLIDNGYNVTVHGSADICRTRIQEFLDQNQCQFVCAPMFELPFSDGHFDTVICIRLLTHCNRWEELVRELCRVAQRNIIIDYPSAKSLNALVSGKIFAFKKKLEGNTRTWRLFRKKELQEAFAKHGFTYVREVKQYFLPMVFHRTLRCPRISSALEGICQLLGLTHLWGSPSIMLLQSNSENKHI